MRRWTIAAGLGIAFAVTASSTARAWDKDDKGKNAESTVAILSLRIGGDADPELRVQLQESIRTGLSAAKLSTVDHDAVRSRLSGTELLDCTSSTCLAQVSEKVGATRFIRAVVEGSGAAYSIDLELLDLRGELTRKLEEDCEVCTISELNDLVAKVTEALLTTKQDEPVPVVIVTRPEGAKISIDAQPAVDAPYSGALAPGKHTVTALLAGHNEAEKAIEVSADEKQQRFEIILTKTRVVDPAGPTARPYKLWKWVAAGGAAVALTAGIVWIAIDGSGTCDLAGMRLECPNVYNTMPQGIAATIVGIGAGAASAWMFLKDRKPAERRSSAFIAPTRSGAMGVVRLRF